MNTYQFGKGTTIVGNGEYTGDEEGALVFSLDHSNEPRPINETVEGPPSDEATYLMFPDRAGFENFVRRLLDAAAEYKGWKK